MAKRIYQKNPGRDDDWIAEGDLAESDLQQFGKNNKIVGLEFRSVTSFPQRPFRHLASMRRLKHLQFHSCPINPADIADLAALSKLESLWFDGCPVGDEGLENLARHPKLSRVALNNTQITDAALEHLAAIPRLAWLWLDGTAVTDRGLAQLATATGLESLAFRDTKVTDEGLLPLARLAKLCLSSGHVHGSAVTDAGLESLFAAQQAAIKSARQAQKTLSKAPATLAPEDIDAAKDVLYGYFKAMNQWEISCFERNAAAEKPGNLDAWEVYREECREIFRRYCTPKKRAYGRPENISIGSPPDYEADPAQEPITAIETPSRQRMVIETKQKFVVQYRCQYVLLKKDCRWLIDSKKIWSDRWEPTIL